jgi:excisionase family DNA binding protein
MEKSLLTVPELSVRLGCSRTSAYELVKSGRVRAVRLTKGGALRVPVDAVKQFIDSLASIAPDTAA